MTGHRRARKDITAALGAISTPILSDNLFRLSAAGSNIRPYHKEGTLFGTAITVRTRPGDNLMIHKAIDIAEKGDVIVVEAGGELTNSLVGELMTTHAQALGLAGFVLDGAVRDLDVLSKSNFPVFAGGVSHRGPYKDGPGEINVPIALSGMIVNPGDVIVGDLDGVLCVPQGDAEDVLRLAKAQEEREQGVLNDIARDGWDRSWVDELLRAKGCDLG